MTVCHHNLRPPYACEDERPEGRCQIEMNLLFEPYSVALIPARLSLDLVQVEISCRGHAMERGLGRFW